MLQTLASQKWVCWDYMLPAISSSLGVDTNEASWWQAGLVFWLSAGQFLLSSGEGLNKSVQEQLNGVKSWKFCSVLSYNLTKLLPKAWMQGFAVGKVAAFRAVCHYILYYRSIDTIDVAVAWKGFRGTGVLYHFPLSIFRGSDKSDVLCFLGQVCRSKAVLGRKESCARGLPSLFRREIPSVLCQLPHPLWKWDQEVRGTILLQSC